MGMRIAEAWHNEFTLSKTNYVDVDVAMCGHGFLDHGIGDILDNPINISSGPDGEETERMSLERREGHRVYN
jgi:hypothetical protein